jgi:hypothetical protein
MGTNATLSVGTLNIGTGYTAHGRFYMNNSAGSTVTVSDNVVIAQGSNQNVGRATGLLDQGTATEVTIGGNLTIGSSYSNDGIGGQYNLADGASLTVTGATAIATAGLSRGRLYIDVGDSASGLTVGTSLAVGTDGLIDITFTEDPLDALLGSALTHTDILYGLMWAGDHETTLTNLDTKLTWDDTTNLTGDFYDAVSIFYDSGTDATYVGFYISIIPEPGSFALLTLGTAWLLNRHRGRSTTGIPACRPAA